MSNPPSQSELVLPLVEETATVTKRQTVRGKVRVHTRTLNAEEVVRASLDEESVEVIRIPIDREVETAPAVRSEGDVTIVPILEEILVVEKRLVLKEELHIRKKVTRNEVDVPVTLRRQEAVVERLDPDGTPLNPNRPETHIAE